MVIPTIPASKATGMPPALFLSGPCKVCEQPARGRHFGVMSCRACAAFFRRSGNGNSKYLGRLCEKKDCKIFHNGKYQCKVCRLKKCHDVGMDPMKFQTDRDLISSTFLARANSISPQSLSNFLGRPEFILSCEPDKASHIKTLIDVSFLIDKARMFFEYNTSGYDIPLKFDNSLEKLTFAMEDMKLKRANLDIATVKYIGKAENMIFWECAFIGAAQWFSELPEFVELHIDVKIEILKTAWLLWARLDKLAQTADFHRRNILEGNKYLWTEDTCTDLKDVEVDLKWCTNYTKEQLAALMVPDVNIHWKTCLDIFMELEPTNTEINFLIIELCLGEVLKKFDGEIVEAADRLLQTQADNLHHYYVNRMKMPHYSGRLAKLIRVNREIQAEVRERKEHKFIGNLFNLFSVEFSHPDMFDYS
ncbi:hypothetical protein GCK72_020001 [Caenorhabditis remanei]|uniref:Uncharacterized protein n=1 Tax=Caenorhabditis remanei TaxID=31234 RepID=A0A6A5GFB9_CAERE|nr:hypothetical protein GCK72_020001 [Caenorhabditis remanei]KAF1753444.1 hypothetical protein GCK72_020001 [Caenorhabditis remanei]